MQTLFSTWFALLGLRRGHLPDSLPHFDTVRQVYQPSSGIGKTLCSLLGREVAFIRGGYPHERNLSKMRANPNQPRKITVRLATRARMRHPPASRWNRRSTAFRRVATAWVYSQGARRVLRGEPFGSNPSASASWCGFCPHMPDQHQRTGRLQAAQPMEHLVAFGRDRVSAKRTCARPDVPRLCGT